MLNIIIPMAGNGSRFKEAGFKDDKPMIKIFNVTMIENVLNNLQTNLSCKFIIICDIKLLNKYSNKLYSIKRKYNLEIVFINKKTEGAACTILHARKYINNNNELVLANCDQIIDIKLDNFIKDARKRKLDGSILTFIDKYKSNKWSFAKVNRNNIVTEVAEKKVISKYATVGIYYFKRGYKFVNSAIDMIINNDRHNNEFYTCPVYNYLIKNNKVSIFNIPQNKMHGIGTPQDLKKYVDYRSNLNA